MNAPDQATGGIINSASDRSSVVILGEGKMAYDCLAKAASRHDIELPFVLTRETHDAGGRRLAKVCDRHSIEIITAWNPNEDEVLRRLRDSLVDVVFNINSFSILKEEFISVPRLGVVNFHNGPLPRYAGVNIPTWAIWNEETEHGVTWHYIDSGIDTGDLIAQASFGIDERETAATLMMKCITTGISMFDGVLDSVLSGQCRRTRQAGERTYYSRMDIPNDGFIDFGWPLAQIDRLIRALDFHPFPNLLVHPRVRCRNSFVSLRTARVREDAQSDSSDPPGTIVETDEERIYIRVRGGHLVVSEFVSPDGEPIGALEAAERYRLSPGLVLG